ncbi:MAG: hypothetical protein IPI49_31780 [Myxococcales bacterium]|nr:hypothetical protein [Myxococcales bacterium]
MKLLPSLFGPPVGAARWLPMAIVGASITAGCATAPRPALVAQVQPGPAAGAPAGKVFLLTPTCGSVEFRCPKEYVGLVDNIVRASLEFSGLAVVTPENLRNQTRTRNEQIETNTTSAASRSSTTVERPLDFDDKVHTESESKSFSERSVVTLDGPGFEDLSVTERQEVLAKAGASSVATVRIVVGAAQNWGASQNVEVMVRLGVNHGETMVWASRCTAGASAYASVNEALEHAARCAVHGATAR